MSSRPVWLAKSRKSLSQRAHFGIFIPNAAEAGVDPNDRSAHWKGTIIHVVGAPMAGYAHEFKRNFDSSTAEDLERMVHIGSVAVDHLRDPSAATFSRDQNATSGMEVAALQISPPRVSQNFLAPVNDTTNRRCQEWTMEYLRHLVSLGYIHESAIGIAQAERDPPAHGIGLQPTNRGSDLAL